MKSTERLEARLLSGPFGDPAGLTADRDTWYAGAAEVIGLPPLPEAAEFGAAQRRILGRVEVDQIIAGEQVLAIGEVTGPSTAPALRERVWATDLTGAGEAAMTQAVSAAFELSGMPAFLPWRLREQDVAALAAGSRRLAEVFPELGPTTVDFIRQVVVHDSPILSAYVTQIPESIFLGSAILAKSPDELAEALLHESLHEKSMVARRTRVLFSAEYSEETSPLLTLPWTLDYPEPRRFSAWRLLSAAHVYTHLSVYCADKSVSEESRTRLPEYASRGQLMLEALASPAFRRSLGPDGLAFTDFLLEALAGLGRSPRYALAEQELTEPVIAYHGLGK